MATYQQNSIKGQPALPEWVILCLKLLISEKHCIFGLTSVQDFLADDELAPATQAVAEERGFSPTNEWEVQRSARFTVLWAICHFAKESGKPESYCPDAESVETAYANAVGGRESKVLITSVRTVANGVKDDENFQAIPSLVGRVADFRRKVWSNLIA